TLEPPPPLGDGDNSPCSSPSPPKSSTPVQNRFGGSRGVWTEQDPPTGGTLVPAMRTSAQTGRRTGGPRIRNGCGALPTRNPEPGPQPWFDVAPCRSACCASSLPVFPRPFTS